MIEFGPDICADLNAATEREWLETNGIGGYASGTISGINTRRYHGLLVAATTPPTGRAVLLAKLEETVVISGKSYELSANQYPNAIYPNGYQLLQSFRLAPFPIWRFEIIGEFGSVEIEKTIFMPNGKNTVVVEYQFTPKSETPNLEFQIYPLVAFRDYHDLRRTANDFKINVQTTGEIASLNPVAELPALNFWCEDAAIEQTGLWYRNFQYARERERGFDFQEDLFQPFVFKRKVSESRTISLIISIESLLEPALSASKMRHQEGARRAALAKPSKFKDSFLEQLAIAADQFIVSRESEKTVIAGYPWFSDWGRDTMIALPGLTLTTGRPEIAKSILLEFSHYVSNGMLPNRFPDLGETPEYNTVDATLWYFEAVRAYLEKTGDYDFVEKYLYEKLVEIIIWHLRGTRFNIHVDTDGLLCAGDENTQLTWMDAKSGDTIFTPRYGKAVEIQALWYNALRVIEDLAERFNDRSGRQQYAAMADLAQISFTQTFWNKDEDCLFDCINGVRDGAVRPNQIFAVSLKHSLIAGEKAQKIIRKVEAELLTPFGLRSLSPKDPKYRGIYQGNSFERDSAYHQGTVWAWLAGAFFTAYAKTFADAPETNNKLQKWLDPFKAHLLEAGVGQISEIFDGDAPHLPRGCYAQAWSTGEILRAAFADIYCLK